VVEPALLFCGFLHVESCAQCPPCKLNSGDVVEFLEALQRGDQATDLDEALARAWGATDGQKCALPTGTSLLMQSLFLTFEEELRSHAASAPRLAGWCSRIWWTGTRKPAASPKMRATSASAPPALP
jgi:NADH:ubiquinone oxidoreductase subunit F (NADH-binding)